MLAIATWASAVPGKRLRKQSEGWVGENVRPSRITVHSSPGIESDDSRPALQVLQTYDKILVADC